MSDPLLELRDALGPLPTEAEPMVPMADFVALQNAIAQDLNQTQGPWRKKKWLARYWPAFAALLMGIGAMFIMPGAKQSTAMLTAASGLGAFAMGICTAAFAMAPDRPSLAENLSKFGLLLASIALLLETILGIQSQMSGLGNAAKCAEHVALFAMPSLGLLSILAWQAKAPFRKLHMLALATSALSVGGVTVWRHCANTGTLHILASHVLPVALGIGAIGMLLYRFLQPKKMLIPSKEQPNKQH